MIRRALVLACLALTAPVQAQTAAKLPALVPPPGVLGAEIGETITRPGAQPGTSVDLYAFVGEAGAMLEATATGKAAGYGATLYTPEGAEMLTTTGMGSAELTAVLPQDAVYILAVTRQNSTEPYKLALAAEAPDIYQWRFRRWVGYDLREGDRTTYSQTCWLKPGETMRTLYSNGRFQYMTVERGGTGYIAREDDAGHPVVVRFTTSVANGTFTRVFVPGNTATWSIDDAGPAPGTYRGYLCH